MATVKVNLGKDSYEIEIERGLLDRVGEKIRALTRRKSPLLLMTMWSLSMGNGSGRC